MSVAPIPAPTPVAAIFPSFATFAHGIKKVTGSAIATPTLPVIVAASFSCSSKLVPYFSSKVLNILVRLSSSIALILSWKVLLLLKVAAPAFTVLKRFPSVWRSKEAPNSIFCAIVGSTSSIGFVSGFLLKLLKK